MEGFWRPGFCHRVHELHVMTSCFATHLLACSYCCNVCFVSALATWQESSIRGHEREKVQTALDQLRQVDTSKVFSQIDSLPLLKG